MARAMSIDELTPTEVGLTTGPDGDGGQVDISMLNTSTPLWFYILREADIRENGQRLGPVGGRIVAEVFIGLLQGDRQSYLRRPAKLAPNYTRSAITACQPIHCFRQPPCT